MSIEDEQSIRNAIKRMIADWDAAYTEGNAPGIAGHRVPEDAQREAGNCGWDFVMKGIEDCAAHSTVRQFHLDGGRATLVVEQNRKFCFRRPPRGSAALGRAFFGFLSRFVFVEREVNRLAWVSTREGWLCESDKRLSYRVRIRQRRSTPCERPGA